MQKIQFVKSKKGLWMKFPIGSNGKLLLPCGGHLGYVISTKITNLVEDHPVIISIMLQFHRLSSFWQEDFQSFNQSTHYWPWQPYWISDLHQNNKSGRGPPKWTFLPSLVQICSVVSEKMIIWKVYRRGWRRTQSDDKSSHGPLGQVS